METDDINKKITDKTTTSAEMKKITAIMNTSFPRSRIFSLYALKQRLRVYPMLFNFLRKIKQFLDRVRFNRKFLFKSKKEIIIPLELSKIIYEYPDGGFIYFRPKSAHRIAAPRGKNEVSLYFLSQGYIKDNMDTEIITTDQGEFIFQRGDYLISQQNKSFATISKNSFWPYTGSAKNHVLPDIIIFSVIDWHFRFQRPQQIAKILAEKGHRVFYISNNFINSNKSFFEIRTIEDNLSLYHAKLALKDSPSIYSTTLSEQQHNQLARSLGQLLYETGCNKVIGLIHHPFWSELAFTLPNSMVVYDCMDHHAGFSDTADVMLQKEKQLFSQADSVIVSSKKLYEEVSKYHHNITIIRNGTEYSHFANKPDTTYQDIYQRKIIGYYGAIAEWFDEGIIIKLAEYFKDCLILLIGADSVGLSKKLYSYQNIVFTGEIDYQKLPYYLHAFDVSIIPFKIIPLTEATNPVKIYEYLSAGKPVVSVDLPELRDMQHVVSLAKSAHEFTLRVQEALDSGNEHEKILARQAFAKQQTWSARAELFEACIANHKEPLVSIIVLTFNNLELTKACLASLERYTDYSNYEVIIVDNASTDGTPDYLKTEYQYKSLFKVILSESNVGFSAGNNIGLKQAAGDYLVILNNDTRVSPGWLRTMVNHFRHIPNLGLLGPVTNNIGNEAKVPTEYTDPNKMLPEAWKIVTNNIGKLQPLYTAAFFCVMFSREVFNKVGMLDENFGLGYFEDDDYCRRVQELGYKILCAEDVFVHHHFSASFNKMKSETRQALFEKNKALYEKKWGTWKPHKSR